MALKRGIVKLEEYNPHWVEEYKEEEKLLKKVLGNKIIEIHHIGSTSIPGLCAKPIIDILIVIESLDEVPEIEEILKNYNYENRGQHGVGDRYFFAKGPEDARTHYIHFVEPNSDTYYNQIYFRDYLIKHPEYLDEYNTLKKDLAMKYASDRPSYTASKDEFIKGVIKMAKEEFCDNMEV